MVLRGAERYRAEFSKAVSKDQFADTYPGSIATKLAIEPFAEAIQEWTDEVFSAKRGRRAIGATLIKDMDPRAIAYVTTKTLLSTIWKSRVMQVAAGYVGKAIMDEARFNAFLDSKPYLYDKINETAKRNGADVARRRIVLIYSMHKFDVEFKEWSKQSQLHLGTQLIDLFRTVTGYIDITKVPAKRRGYSYVVGPSEKLLNFVKDRNDLGEYLRPLYQPMLVPPRPWQGLKDGGGYLYMNRANDIPLIKRRFENRVKFRDGEATMPLVYQGVNAIQETPWRVNKRTLSVLSDMWTGNMDIPGIPNRENMEVPPFPVEGSDEDKIMWKKEAREIYDANAESTGRRMIVSMTLDTANAMANEEAIYFPHNTDFRGRVYPIPPALSPQGSDFSRSILELGKGLPLGDYDAARWLAIHGANLWGYDKQDFEERVQWVHEHEEEILWSAEEPLKFNWWHKADKPFSFLAFCFEWEGYKRDGLDHVSRIPIALDGTCNGLQHFSAMLRDSVGGAAVNLLPSEKPQDIYQAVADVVTRRLRGRQEDDQKNLWASTWLSVGIDRKVTKRPVMCLPYGVSFLSSSNYVQDAVKKRMNGENPFGDDWRHSVLFLSRHVWDGISEVVVAAREAMSWLKKVARVASKYGAPLEWTTPSGFKVKQRYVSVNDRRVKTQLFGKATYLSLREPTDKTNKKRQAGAIPPNFVHSLDASAMMLTIDKALGEGITDFAMIHDSYGTHAANTERFSRLIREAFVEMYKEHDVLQEFLDDIKDLLPEEAHAELPPLPAKGNLVIEDVLKSDFFFS